MTDGFTTRCRLSTAHNSLCRVSSHPERLPLLSDHDVSAVAAAPNLSTKHKAHNDQENTHNKESPKTKVDKLTYHFNSRLGSDHEDTQILSNLVCVWLH